MLSNILTFSNHDEAFKEISNLTYEHNKKYFEKFNIEYKVFNVEVEESLGKNHHGSMQKNYYTKWTILKNLMETRKDIDYFFAIDTDIVICDFDFDLRYFTRMTNKHILLCSIHSCSPDMFWNVNAGSMIVKNSSESYDFISFLLHIASKSGYNTVDQVVLQNMLRTNEKIRDLVSIFPNTCFNAGNPNAFLFHDCKHSTSNQPIECCLHNKLQSLKNVINGNLYVK